MPVNSTHPDYASNCDSWQRIRDVVLGDAAINAGGKKYVARLDSQTDQEFQAYVNRGFFYNATARTVSGYIGLIFRRDPVLLLPDKSAALHAVLKGVVNDVDLLGTTLDSYSRNVISSVICVGRAGTLVDWHGEGENRAYLSLYSAESILNWRQIRIDGHVKLSLVVLAESAPGQPKDNDPFVVHGISQLRVLKLVPVQSPHPDPRPLTPALSPEGARVSGFQYVVEIWQLLPASDNAEKMEWRLVRSLTPTRLGKPLSTIPFIFHGPSHSRPDVEKSPIEDIVAANLDHYRLNTDYKHGMHFTPLPTAFVTGFDKASNLRIGSTTAWVTDTLGATAGYLEFKGDGLMTFEWALDRVERLLTVLGSRLLESPKRVSESAAALAIRQAGESSIIASISTSVTASMNAVLRWVYWWHSTEAKPEDVTPELLNTGFDSNLLSATEIQARVAAWQSGAISQDTLLHNLRTGEILPSARTNEQELELIRKEPAPAAVASVANAAPAA